MTDTPCLYPEGASPEYMMSVTQISARLSCGRRWEYGYRDGIRQRRERDYLTMGKLCHAGMEAAMRERWGCAMDGEDPDLDRLVRAGRAAINDTWDGYMEVTDFLPEEVPEQRELLTRALGVFEEALEEFDPLRWLPVTVVRGGEAVPALELHFLIPCADSDGMHGYIDAVLRDLETGQTWCVDYKFRRTLAADDDERFNLQNAVYMMACRRMGIDVAGTMTWQRYNAPSAVPRINQDGSASRAKIRCTWPRYRRFLEEAGLDPADYKDMEGKLADVEMCRATREVRSDHMVDQVWDQVVAPSARSIMASLDYEDGREIPSLDPWTCRMCSFQSLCQAELRGYDVQYVLESEYTLKDYRK